MRSVASIIFSLLFLYFLSTEKEQYDQNFPIYFNQHLKDTFLIKERFHTDTVFLSSIDKKLHFKRLKFEHYNCNCKSYKIVNGETIEAGAKSYLTPVEILIPIDSISIRFDENKFKIGHSSKRFKVLSKLD